MMTFHSFLPLFVLICGAAAAQPLADTPQEHSVVIDSSRHEYSIRMGGHVDAANSREPIFSAAPKQVFEPMRSVRIENTGDVDVVNPWILVNGKRNWRTANDIVDEALRTYGDPAAMTPAEKARAVYEFLRNNRFHATTGDLEVRDPVKLLNVYGFALCGDNAPALMDLWRLAGLPVRRGFASGHCVSEAFHDGAWHMLDADESSVFLERDNETIASDRDLARDHELVKRGSADETDAGLYPYDGPRGGEYPSHVEHAMRLTLRPGEALEWRWGHVGKHHQAAAPLYAMRSTNLGAQWGKEGLAQLSNGKWIYAPPLRKASARQGGEARNVRWLSKTKGPAVTPEKAGEPASLSWKISAPYVIVGGKFSARLDCRAGGAAAFQASLDGRKWKEVLRVDGPSKDPVEASLDGFFPNVGPAVYQYWFRAELLAKSKPGDAGLESLVIENDLQMAPLSLPSLALGVNRILYSDETAGPHSVTATFHWVERTSWRLPEAPAAPVSPVDGASVAGTQITFRWEPAAHPEAERMTGYHFQLGVDPGLRWTLSSAFDRLVPGTEAGASPVLILPRPGLLNPGDRYYWRVRARSEKGVWGPWSKVWNFVPEGPGVPQNVRLAENPAGGFELAWAPNPKGRRPVEYRVYASNEKGFTVSETPYQAAVGNQKDKGLFPGQKTAAFPANRLTKVSEPRLPLEPAHAFYRVVAVDEKGIMSGASEYAAAPRPFIYSHPPTEVKAGEPYRYEVKTIRSIGDFSYRDFLPDQFYQGAFWDAEKLKFSIVDELSRCGNNVPAWLHLDPATGVLSGTPRPEDTGEYQINVRVEIEGAGVYVQSYTLKVHK